jgi:hypothetical protein
LSLKRLSAKVPDARVRIALRPTTEGAIRATVGSAGASVEVEVLSDGTILRR